MSETPPPYAAHTPAPIRFRVWDPDSELMHSPDEIQREPRYGARIIRALALDGAPFRVVDARDGDYVLLDEEPHPYGLDLVPLLSTGLRDADGAEVFDGDILEWPTPEPEAWFTVIGREGLFGAWALNEDGLDLGRDGTVGGDPIGFDDLSGPSVLLGRVVGNVYQGLREPA